MDDIIKLFLDQDGKSEIIDVAERYMKASEDLVLTAKQIGDDSIKKEIVRKRIETRFVKVWNRSDLVKLTIERGGVTKENKVFLIAEMRNLAEQCEELTNEIKEILNDLK